MQNLNTNMPYQCEICGYTFSNEYDLEKHIQCSQYDKAFTKKNNHDSHVKTHTVDQML